MGFPVLILIMGSALDVVIKGGKMRVMSADSRSRSGGAIASRLAAMCNPWRNE
jgi:hypothetical protein